MAVVCYLCRYIFCHYVFEFQAKSFHGELQDVLQQLGEIDGHLTTAPPVGGLPETAKKQLDEFSVCALLEFSVSLLKTN